MRLDTFAGSIGTEVIWLFIGSGFALFSRLFSPEMALAMLFASYVALGLLEEIIFFRSRRREEQKTHPVDAEDVAPAFEDDEEEDEADRLA